MNPTMDRQISWECKISYTSDSDEVEQWQNWLHEITTLNSNMMIGSLCCVSKKVRDLPTYDGLREVDVFLDTFEREKLEKQCFQTLNWVLRATPSRWWGMHKGSFDE